MKKITHISCLFLLIFFFSTLSLATDFEQKYGLAPYISLGDESIPFFGDTDGDGDQDLFIWSKQSTFILYYENIGTSTSPIFMNRQKNINYAGDAGEVILAFSDNVQGETSDYWVLQIYESSEDNGTHFFVNTDAPRLNISRSTASSWEWSDMDGDGDLDLIFAELSLSSINAIRILWNLGNSTDPVLFSQSANGFLCKENKSWDKMSGSVTYPRQFLNFTGNWTINFADVDEDGDEDLLLAVTGVDNRPYGLYYVHNIGTIQNRSDLCGRTGVGYEQWANHGWQYTLQEVEYIADRSGSVIIHGNTIEDTGRAMSVCTADLDADGHLDLVTSGNDDAVGTIYRYLNLDQFSFNIRGTEEPQTYTMPSYTHFNNTNPPYISGIDNGARTFVACADLYGDGMGEIVTGNAGGNIFLYGATEDIESLLIGLTNDTKPPIVTLDEPIDSKIVYANEDIRFGFNVSENGFLSNCYLYIFDSESLEETYVGYFSKVFDNENPVANLTRTQLANNEINYFTYSFTENDYLGPSLWGVKCTDSKGNEGRSGVQLIFLNYDPFRAWKCKQVIKITENDGMWLDRKRQRLTIPVFDKIMENCTDLRIYDQDIESVSYEFVEYTEIGECVIDFELNLAPYEEKEYTIFYDNSNATTQNYTTTFIDYFIEPDIVLLSEYCRYADEEILPLTAKINFENYLVTNSLYTTYKDNIFAKVGFGGGSYALTCGVDYTKACLNETIIHDQINDTDEEIELSYFNESIDIVDFGLHYSFRARVSFNSSTFPKAKSANVSAYIKKDVATPDETLLRIVIGNDTISSTNATAYTTDYAWYTFPFFPENLTEFTNVTFYANNTDATSYFDIAAGNGSGEPVITYDETGEEQSCDGTFDAGFPCTNCNDTNWESTACGADVGAGTLAWFYTNYTKPATVFNATWQISTVNTLFYKQEILNVSTYDLAIAVNGSNTVFKTTSWVNTFTMSDPYFHFRNITNFNVTNQTTRLSLDNENGTSSYQASSVYSSDAQVVWHLHNYSDATPNLRHLSTYISAPDLVEDCVFADCQDFELDNGDGLEYDGLNQDAWTEFSVVAFIKIESIGAGDPYVWVTGEDTSYGLRHLKVVTTDSKLLFGVGDGSVIKEAISGANTATVGEWTMVVGTAKENDFVKIYVNDTEAASIAIGTFGNPALTQRIGRWTGTNHFDGRIDEVRIYDRQLTQAEISFLYNNSRNYNMQLGETQFELENETNNFTVNSSCWDYDRSKLIFRIEMNGSIGGDFPAKFQCYDNHTDYTVDTHGDEQACGGTWDVSFPCSNVNDTNWNSFGNADTNKLAYWYVNYTKPANAISAKWEFKTTPAAGGAGVVHNLTINDSCWNYDESKIIFRVTLNGTFAPSPQDYSCQDGADSWKSVYFDAANAYADLYEENIWWNLTEWTDVYTKSAGPPIQLWEEAIWWGTGLTAEYQYNSTDAGATWTNYKAGEFWVKLNITEARQLRINITLGAESNVSYYKNNVWTGVSDNTTSFIYNYSADSIDNPRFKFLPLDETVMPNYFYLSLSPATFIHHSISTVTYYTYALITDTNELTKTVNKRGMIDDEFSKVNLIITPQGTDTVKDCRIWIQEGHVTGLSADKRAIGKILGNVEDAMDVRRIYLSDQESTQEENITHELDVDDLFKYQRFHLTETMRFAGNIGTIESKVQGDTIKLETVIWAECDITGQGIHDTSDRAVVIKYDLIYEPNEYQAYSTEIAAANFGEDLYSGKLFTDHWIGGAKFYESIIFLIIFIVVAPILFRR